MENINEKPQLLGTTPDELGAYLKAQGQEAGEKSYGMVVDLAVAYVQAQNAAAQNTAKE